MFNNDELKPFNDFVKSSLGFPRIKQTVAVEMERPLGGVHFNSNTLSFNYNLLKGFYVAKTSKIKPYDLLKNITAPTREISRSLMLLLTYCVTIWSRFL